MDRKARATIKDLYKVPDDGKAEIVNGDIVLMPPTGAEPNYAAGEIFASLREYVRRTKNGRAVTDNAGFRVNLPAESRSALMQLSILEKPKAWSSLKERQHLLPKSEAQITTAQKPSAE